MTDKNAATLVFRRPAGDRARTLAEMLPRTAQELRELATAHDTRRVPDADMDELLREVNVAVARVRATLNRMRAV